MSVLDELLSRFNQLPEAERAELLEAVSQDEKVWTPSPGPQTDAYLSEADILLFGGEPGGGKGLDIHTVVPTPHGSTTMGALQVGDVVFDKNGKPCCVTFKSKVHHRPCFEVELSDGSKFITDDVHKWLTRTSAERKRALAQSDEWRAKRRASRPSRGKGKKLGTAAANTARAEARRDSLPAGPYEGVRTTQEIYETLRVGSDNRANHSVDVAGALQLPEADLLIDPYVLGAWLGDGSARGSAVYKPDESVFENVAAAGYTVTRGADPLYHGVLGLQTELKALGVFGNKHIPVLYLRASIQQRLALLQGLMDTDGHANDRGQCELCLTRKPLIDGALDLIRSLGIKANTVESRASLNGEDYGPKYTIKFITDLPAFRMPRKLIQQKRANFRGTHDVRYIVDVRPVPTVPTQCIQVSSPSRTYLIGEAFIPTHNSDLILGLAFNEQQRSLILRRQYTDLTAITDRAIQLNGTRKGYNGAAPPSLRRGTQLIEFGACAKIGDEQAWQGRAHDFIGIDEATQFAESQVRFLMGWLRSTDKNQRKRVVFATNPPLAAEGLWVIEMFAPWLDKRHPNPAQPGELRWFVVNAQGNDQEVPGPDPVEINGKLVTPLSRTYIPSSVSDNPYLSGTDYEAQLDALPEPFRSILMGGFQTVQQDQERQLIPTDWIRDAMQRWTPAPRQGVPMSAMGVDVACSEDDTVLAPRYDGWYDELVAIPGRATPNGSDVAGLVFSKRKGDAIVIVDIGGGYGNGVVEHLKNNGIDVLPFNGANASDRRTKDRMLKFVNRRAEAWWAFREALDPDQDGGSPIMLPDDPKLLADLAAPTFKITPNGILVESKIDIKKRLGRSPDRGDAVVMAWCSGPIYKADGAGWTVQRELRKLRRTPRILTGRKR